MCSRLEGSLLRPSSVPPAAKSAGGRWKQGKVNVMHCRLRYYVKMKKMMMMSIGM